MNANRDLKVDLERALEEFESSWSAADRPSIEGFLPDPSHPKYLELLAELIRCDMEFAWDAGIKETTEQLTAPFPMIRDSREHLEAIAFEEYRLRHAAGEAVSPVDFHRRLGISTEGWPTWKPVQTPVIDEKQDWPSISGSSNQASQHRIRRQSTRALNLPTIGSQFCGFEIVGELGRGAFGRVFLARQDDLANRFVALKVSCQHSDEHQYLARLQHTNIVPVYSVHRSGNLQAICMPFLGVVTLRDILSYVHTSKDAIECPKSSHALVSTIAKQKAETIVETIKENEERQSFRKVVLTDDRATVEDKAKETYLKSMASTIMQVARGLGYAHDRGIVHGDLKPANVLLSDDGHPLLLDFHLSKSVDDLENENVGGTLPYMSPEHLSSLQTGQAIDARADVYSMGVILHEMLSGELPYDSSVKEDLESQIPDLIQLRKSVVENRQNKTYRFGVDLDSIIDKCLQPNPDARYASANELADDLQLHLHDRPLIHSKNRSIVELGRKWLRRHPRLTSASSIAVVSLLGLAFLLTILFSYKLTLDRSAAVERLTQFLDQATYAKLDIAVVGLEPNTYASAIRDVQDVLDEFNCVSINSLRESRDFQLLDFVQRQQQSATASDLYFWIAEAKQRLAWFDDIGANSLLLEALQCNEKSAQFLSDSDTGRGLLIQKSRILNRLGRSEESKSLTTLSQEIPIFNSTDRLTTAYLTQNDYEQSIKWLTQVVEEDPTDFVGWLMLGHVHMNKHKYVEAQTCYSLCLNLDPDNAVAYFNRGVAHYWNEHYEEANTDLAQARLLRPNYIDYIENHALALIKTKQWQQAKDALDKAIELGSKHTRIWYLRSNVRARLGDAQGAKKDLDYFMTSKPCDEISWTTRGVRNVGASPEQAMADFQAAIKVNPEYVQAYENIAYLQSEKMNDVAGAIRTMDRIVQLEPLDPAHVATRGVLHSRNKNRDLAHDDAQLAIKIRSDADTHYRVAGIYAQTSQLEPTDAEIALRHLATAAVMNAETVMRMMKNDPDIKPLSQNPKFQSLIESIGEVQNMSKSEEIQ